MDVGEREKDCVGAKASGRRWRVGTSDQGQVDVARCLATAAAFGVASLARQPMWGTVGDGSAKGSGAEDVQGLALEL